MKGAGLQSSRPLPDNLGIGAPNGQGAFESLDINLLDGVAADVGT